MGLRTALQWGIELKSWLVEGLGKRRTPHKSPQCDSRVEVLVFVGVRKRQEIARDGNIVVLLPPNLPEKIETDRRQGGRRTHAGAALQILRWNRRCRSGFEKRVERLTKEKGSRVEKEKLKISKAWRGTTTF